MEQGQPFRLAAILPTGVTIDDLLIGGAALGVFLLIWSIGQLFVVRDPLTARMRAVAVRRQELKGALVRAKRRTPQAAEGRMNLVRALVGRLKLLQQHQTDALQRKLTQAGYRSKDAVFVFAFAKLVMPVVGVAVGVLASGMDWDAVFSRMQTTAWLTLIGCGYLGARLPDILVSNRRTKRYASIRKALPDALDLMMICAEAGLSLAAALDRVARELARVSPELSEEFSLASVELGFLPDRATALKNLAQRVEIKELTGFVNVVVQTEKYGTPIAQALRVLSKEFRTERMLRAEQKAARLPALMTVPMIVFILPTMFIIVMAPAIINVLDTMK